MAFSLLDACTVIGAAVGVVGLIVGAVSLALYIVDRAKKK